MIGYILKEGNIKKMVDIIIHGHNLFGFLE